jgi:raffinose/stachyose/melibiose transport system permease protein
MKTASLKTENRFGIVFSLVIQYLIIAVFLVVAVFPLVWVALSAFRTNSEILSTAIALPKTINFNNFQKAFEGGHLFIAFKNSLIVTFFSIVLNAFLAFFVAYALNRFDFKLNSLITVFITLGILIPINAAMMPISVIMNRLHLNNSLVGLILLYTAFGLPISSLILKSFINSIPVELDKAAMVDGATHYQILAKVIFPLCPAGFSIVAIQQFILSWNEFLFAMILISSEGNRTLQLAISYFVGKYFSNYGAMFAAILFAIIPAIVVFALLQEKVIKGLTAGALKG